MMQSRRRRQRSCAWVLAGLTVVLTVGVASTQGAPAVALNGGWAPQWSPDGTRIAYAGPQLDGEQGFENLVVMSSVDGSGKRTLAHARGSAVSEIRWPSARRIVFDLNPDGILRSVDATTGSLTTLARNLEDVAIQFQDAAFSVSPDGRSVVYTLATSPERLGIGQIASTGGAARVVPQVRTVTDEQPSFSPDGKRMVVARGAFVAHGGFLAHPSLVIIGATGGAGRRLVVSGEDPQWSPDGRWIAFLRTHGNGRYSRLEIVPAGGGAPRVLADLVAAFSWAPDSQLLAYVRYDGRSQSSSLATVSVAGANHPLVVDATPLADRPPVWSPDGTRIAFTDVDVANPGHMGIDVVGADGAGLRRLA